jgi:1-acyl-sn-glycerol-3-phosphate acyltransferase
MITALIVALILIAIVCVVAQALLKIVKVPEPLPTVVWAAVVIVCLLLLLDVFTGHRVTGWAWQ